MNTEMPNHRRRYLIIALLGLFIGLLAFSQADEALNQEIAFEYVLNNTDLYEIGERNYSVNYTTNSSAIEIFLIFHVIGSGASQEFDTNLSINGTVVSDRDFRTTAGAGVHEHFSMVANIPKNSVYSVTNTSNVYDIEWREYPILSGRNGTLSVNQSGGSGASSLSQLTIDTNKDWMNYSITNVSLPSDNTKVNISGDNMTGTLIFNPDNISLDHAAKFDPNTWGNLVMSKNDNLVITGAQSHSNNTAFSAFFGAAKTGWNSTTQTKYPLQANDQIFSFYGIGWDGVTWGSSTANMVIKTGSTAWNSTSHPTKFVFQTTGITGSKADRMSIEADGNITINQLAGTGNAYVCVDSTGKLYRGNPGC